MTLLALRAVGVMDARARGLVVLNALVRSRVFLFPTTLVYEELSELLMILHPKHCVDPIFFQHGIPRAPSTSPVNQTEIVSQQIVWISGRRSAIYEQRHRPFCSKNQSKPPTFQWFRSRAREKCAWR